MQLLVRVVSPFCVQTPQNLGVGKGGASLFCATSSAGRYGAIVG